MNRIASSFVCAAMLLACSGDDRRALEGGAGAGAPVVPEETTDAAPPPPGSAASKARRYFVDRAYPAMKACASCHASGGNGATLFMAADADKTYETLDANGLITYPSPLLVKGPHAGGTGPQLDPGSQEPVVREWLRMEQGERAGKDAPEDILSRVGRCMDSTLFARADLCMLTTKPRIGENGNECTGCKYEACANCHTAGGQQTGFWCSATTVNGRTTTNVPDTLEASRTLPYIRRYFGLNGTTPVASNGIANKSRTTASASTVTAHPWFEIDAARTRALDAFVQDAITRYREGRCPP